MLTLNAVTIAVIVFAGVEPEATKIVFAVFAGAGLPVTAIITPFTLNEPVGWIKLAILALLNVNDAVVENVLFSIFVLVADVQVLLALTTLATNNDVPPLLK